MPAFPVIPLQGTIFKVGDGADPEVMLVVDSVNTLTLGSGSTAFTDITDFSVTDGYNRYNPGVRNLGDSTFGGNYNQKDNGQKRLKALDASQDSANFEVTLETGEVGTFSGFVAGFNLNGAGVSSNIITYSFSITHDEDIVWVIPE